MCYIILINMWSDDVDQVRLAACLAGLCIVHSQCQYQLLVSVPDSQYQCHLFNKLTTSHQTKVGSKFQVLLQDFLLEGKNVKNLVHFFVRSRNKAFLECRAIPGTSYIPRNSFVLSLNIICCQ